MTSPPQLSRASVAEGKCLVCGESVLPQVRVECARCRTTHHLDCFRYNGMCALYGCGERGFVSCRPGALRAVRRVAPWLPGAVNQARHGTEKGEHPAKGEATQTVVLDVDTRAEKLGRALAMGAAGCARYFPTWLTPDSFRHKGYVTWAVLVAPLYVLHWWLVDRPRELNGWQTGKLRQALDRFLDEWLPWTRDPSFEALCVLVAVFALFLASIAELSSMRDAADRIVPAVRDQLASPAASGISIPAGPLEKLVIHALGMKLVVGTLLLVVGIALPRPSGTDSFVKRSAL